MRESIEICNSDHDEIAWTKNSYARSCPVCQIMKEMEDLKAEIKTLTEELEVSSEDNSTLLPTITKLNALTETTTKKRSFNFNE